MQSCIPSLLLFVAVVTHIGFSGEPLTSCLHPTISSTHTNYSHTYYSHTYYSHKTTIQTPNTPTHATHTHTHTTHTHTTHTHTAGLILQAIYRLLNNQFHSEAFQNPEAFQLVDNGFWHQHFFSSTYSSTFSPEYSSTYLENILQHILKYSSTYLEIFLNIS